MTDNNEDKIISEKKEKEKPKEKDIIKDSNNKPKQEEKKAIESEKIKSQKIENKKKTETEEKKVIEKKTEVKKNDDNIKEKENKKEIEKVNKDDKKPVDKKPEEKKIEDKKAVDKKPEEKKIEDKKVEKKKIEDKKIEDKKVEDKKVVEKKPVEDKKVEDKKVEDKKVENKKPVEKKTEDKKAEDKKVEDKKLEDKKPTEKKTEDKKPVEDKKVEDKKPTEKKPVEDKKIEDKKPEEKKLPEKKQEEKKLPEKKPEEKKLPEKKPEDKKIEDKKPEEKKLPEKKPEDKKIEDKKPEEKKVPEKKPEEKKLPEKKPEEKKLPEKKPEEKKLPEKKQEEKKLPEKKPEEKKLPEKKQEEKKLPEKKPEEKKLPEKKPEDKKLPEQEKELKLKDNEKDKDKEKDKEKNDNDNNKKTDNEINNDFGSLSRNSMSMSKSTLLNQKKLIKKWKKKIAKFLDSTPVVVTMSIFTVFALFASDIQMAWLSKKVDTAFNIIEIILLVLFSLELILSVLAKDGYLNSFFFWLDLISTVSMIQDIDYIMNPILGYEPIKNEVYTRGRRRASTAQAAKAISKVSAASRATRVLRVIRIVRLIRMVKLYKNVLLEREKKTKKMMEEKKKLMEQLENERNEASLVKTTGSSLSDEESNLKNSLNDPTNPLNSNANNINENIHAASSSGGNSENNNNNAEVHNNNHNDFYENNGDSTRRPSKGVLMSTDKGDIGKNQTLKKLKIKKQEHERRIKDKAEEDKRKKFHSIKSKTILEDGNDDDDEDNEQIIKESRISKMVTESLTKKVIILILSLLLIFPLLSDDFYEDDSSIVYNLLCEFLSTNYAIFTKEGLVDKNLNLTALFDPKYLPVNITIGGERLEAGNSSISNFDFRYKELKTVYSEDTQIRIVYSIRKETKLQGLLNFCQTIFVCICLTLASLTFEKDADDLVLDPLEVMIEIVEKVEKDPIGAKNIEELQEGVKAQVQQLEDNEEGNDTKKKENSNSDNFEVSVIKSAIIKISALLAIGFGEAGGEIIKKNLQQGEELNPRLMGKKKTAIFGFCDIRQFEEIALALEERTILFVNEIAEIIHSSVDKFQGATNKNIGESFLNVWKFYNISKVHNHRNGEEKIIKKDNLLEIDPTNPQVGITADCSILAFLRCILKINKNLNILAYRENPEILKRIPNFKVNMGFGLHLGYGIEGAVGSSYKIDASYLSPNVNIAARLETATRQFGLSILISGVLYDLCTDDMKNVCRYIDCVTVKGSELPLDLYTIDLNLNVTPQEEKHILIASNKEKKTIFAEKKMKLEAMIEEYGAVTPIILDKKDYRELIKYRTENFKDSWNNGIECYKSGNWKDANMYFQTCYKMDPNDGPSKILLDYIRARKLQAPKDWKGVRELTSK